MENYMKFKLIFRRQEDENRAATPPNSPRATSPPPSPASHSRPLPVILKRTRPQNVEDAPKSLDANYEPRLINGGTGHPTRIDESIVRAIQTNEAVLRASELIPPEYFAFDKYTRKVLMRMEPILLSWIKENNLKESYSNARRIRKKALEIVQHMHALEGTGTALQFTASDGWLVKFLQRYNINFSSNSDEAEMKAVQSSTDRFATELLSIIEEEDYSAHHIFNAKENVLHWKKTPAGIALSKEERANPELRNFASDTLSLLLCANAAGDYKCTPLLIYKRDEHAAMRDVDNNSQRVYWRSNSSSSAAHMTRKMFFDWFTNSFCPEVKRYCKTHNLPFKALLLVDDAPNHLPDIATANGNVKVMFFPPNTPILVQPMNQGILATFRNRYFKRVFNSIMTVFDYMEAGVTLVNFFRSYAIVDAIANIDAAWTAIQADTVNAAWKKLWPACVRETGGLSRLAVQCPAEVKDDGEDGEHAQPYDMLEIVYGDKEETMSTS